MKRGLENTSFSKDIKAKRVNICMTRLPKSEASIGPTHADQILYSSTVESE